MNGQEKAIKTIKRSHSKDHTRPRTRCGNHVRRILISYHEKQDGMLRRIAVDAIFSTRLQKPRVIEFDAVGGRGKTARFYLPKTLPSEKVVAIVSDWFQSLAIHDSQQGFAVQLEPEERTNIVSR